MTFYRLTANGPGALEDWGAMPAGDLLAGDGRQHGHLWLDDPASGLMVGVWACTPMTGRMDAWSTNEVMVLIEGGVVIDHDDGSQLAVEAGEAFFIPKGTVCSWRQTGNLKKFFVIHNDGSGLVAADPSALRARKIAPSAALTPAQGPDPALLLGPAPVCSEAIAFVDLTGQLSAGTWAASPYQRKAARSARHELMHIVEGEVTIEDGAGRAETFRAGETCFVPLGAMASWSSSGQVRKIFASFTPDG